ncbi:MAG: ComEA family DNA-binding protein [Bacteroidota bacterium]
MNPKNLLKDIPVFFNKSVILRYIYIIFILATNNLNAQEKPKAPQQVIDELVEYIIMNTDEQKDLSILYDELEYYISSPLAINQANRDELEQIPFLNEFQIQSLLEYRNYYGNIMSINELQYIHGFNKEIVKKISPFITTKNENKNEKRLFKKFFAYGKHNVILRAGRILENQKGYAEQENINNPGYTGYIGNPEKYYTKYRIYYKKNISIGFTADKDPGEPFFTQNNQYGYDFYTAHFYYSGKGFIKKIAIGDYQLGFGQGLTLWSGFSFNKSPSVLNIKKRPRGIQKYTSANENNFMRGGATTLSMGHFNISLFYSRKSIDANISVYDSINNEPIEVSSIQNSGLHNTYSLLEDKNSLKETISGAHINYFHRFFNIGLSGVHTIFNADINPGNHIHDKYDFHNSQITNLGLHYKLHLNNDMFLFGETGICNGMNAGTVNGMLMKWTPRINVSLLYRYYEQEFISLYGKAFAENSYNSNEEGWYTGIEITPFKRWQIKGFADIFNFPWLKYRVNSPSSGVEYFVQTDYHTSKDVKMYWRFQYQEKKQNTDVENIHLEYIVPVSKNRLRYHITYQINKKLTLKNRIQLLWYQKENTHETGYLIYQDVQYAFQRPELACVFRFGMFDTDSYASRIYAYENNVLYAFSIPAYYNQGIRTYLLLKHSLKNDLTFETRYALSYYPNETKIGSGLNEIEGNKKSEITMQVRYRF